MANPPPLQAGHTYHIYNRGNNGEDIFREERNYAYFLNLFVEKVLPVTDVFAYCLMRNHFHLVVRVKENVVEHLSKGSEPFERSARRTASQGFSNLFNTYTQSINKAHQRTGSLFEHPFHRRQVMTDAYFIQLVAYVHLNPQKHGFVKDFRDWPHSSYRTLLAEGATKLQRAEVLAAFGGRDRFIEAHKNAKPETWLLDQDFD